MWYSNIVLSFLFTILRLIQCAIELIRKLHLSENCTTEFTLTLICATCQVECTPSILFPT